MSLEERIKGHLNSSRCRLLYSALKKYGIENFEISVIDDTALDIDTLNKLEEKYIEEYNSMAPNGYNLNSGGYNKFMSEESKALVSKALKGRAFSEEHCKNISKSLMGERHPMFGKKHTDESKQKMSEALTGEKNGFYGRHHTEETKEKLRMANLGRHPSDELRRKWSEFRRSDKNPLRGRKLSEEMKKRISATLTGRHHSEESRRKISESGKGRLCSEETRKKLSKALTGRTFSDEQRIHMIEGAKHRPPVSDEFRRRMSEINKKNLSSLETREKIGRASKRLWNKKKFLPLIAVLQKIIDNSSKEQ